MIDKIINQYLRGTPYKGEVYEDLVKISTTSGACGYYHPDELLAALEKCTMPAEVCQVIEGTLALD
jgi:hypothetical protein